MVPDLPRGLVRINYGRSTPAELISILLALKRVANFSETIGDKAFESPLLTGIIDSFGMVTEPLKVLLEAIDEKKAKEGLKAELWKDLTKYEAIANAQDVSEDENGPPQTRPERFGSLLPLLPRR